MRLGQYLKAAFTNRWNMLAFLGAMGFSVLSGHADVLAPIVLAGELAYLGLLGTHPKFQRYVDAQMAKAARGEGEAKAEQRLREIMAALPKPLLARYKALRDRCAELREIALNLKHPAQAAAGLPFESFQVEGLDRLLWIYLRLLYTRHALGRFLERTDEQAITADIASLERRLEALGERDHSQIEKLEKTLQDNLQTCRDRLANYRKARDNFELLELEIDRLENKIQSLSELAVNRQEPDFISGQVDQVASSMLETERTMNELKFATGFDTTDDAVPELLERQKLKQKITA